jgi:DNA (cytosine-5)-methyltransferase 1
LALFAGIGCLELGLHRAVTGYRTVCYVERDAYAAATLVARMAQKAVSEAVVFDDEFPLAGPIPLVRAYCSN